MLLDEPVLPLYYVLTPGLPESAAESVLSLLGIHPVSCVVISRVNDAAIAFKVCPYVIRQQDEASALTTAHRLSTESGKPALVIGKADFLDAVYSDGRREQVAYHA